MGLGRVRKGEYDENLKSQKSNLKIDWKLEIGNWKFHRLEDNLWVDTPDQNIN